MEQERYHPPVSDVRMSAEMVSISYLHCILKGLWKAPGIIHNGCFGATLFTDEIDFMISPFACWGLPHDACTLNNIPIIVVRENDTIFKDFTYFGKEENIIRVDNYLEAAGLIASMRIGVSRESVRRPLKHIIVN